MDSYSKIVKIVVVAGIISLAIAAVLNIASILFFGLTPVGLAFALIHVIIGIALLMNFRSIRNI